MFQTINLYYIISILGKEQIMHYKILFDTDIIKDLNHKNLDYYIGFSGFDNHGKIITTPLSFDFYYFYNMIEDIQIINDTIKFLKEMSYIELIDFEIHRIKKLKDQELITHSILNEELSKYKKYLAEMSYWISNNGSPQLKLRLYNNEDIKLCYLIERVNIDKQILNACTI